MSLSARFMRRMCEKSRLLLFQGSSQVDSRLKIPFFTCASFFLPSESPSGTCVTAFDRVCCTPTKASSFFLLICLQEQDVLSTETTATKKGVKNKSQLSFIKSGRRRGWQLAASSTSANRDFRRLLSGKTS